MVMDSQAARISTDSNVNLLSLDWKALGRLVRDRAMAEAASGMHDSTSDATLGDGSETDLLDRMDAKRGS